MGEYKTEKQKTAFVTGLIVMLILHIGFDLCEVEGWGAYVGIPMIIFSFICAYQYGKDNPK